MHTPTEIHHTVNNFSTQRARGLPTITVCEKRLPPKELPSPSRKHLAKHNFELFPKWLPGLDNNNHNNSNNNMESVWRRHTAHVSRSAQSKSIRGSSTPGSCNILDGLGYHGGLQQPNTAGSSWGTSRKRGRSDGNIDRSAMEPRLGPVPPTRLTAQISIRVNRRSSE